MAHLLIWGRANDLLSSGRAPRHAEEVQTFGALRASLDGKTAALVLADPDRIEAERDAVQRWLDGGGRTQSVLIAVTNPGDGDTVLERMPFVDDVISRPVTPGRIDRKVKRAFERIQYNRMLGQLRENLERKTADLKSLNDIGVALSAERDIHQLLDKILQKSREITRADAGSLYIVLSDEKNGRKKHLQFKLAHNYSRDVDFKEHPLPLDEHSMAGYAALHNETLNIEDAYKIPPNSPYKFSRSFDEGSGYRTRSVLVVPMLDHKKEVIGVVQLINKKTRADTFLHSVSIVEDEVIHFTRTDEDLVVSLASQAAVAYQNAELLKNIRSLFDRFVDAAVKAVEIRDPVTSGHSERVAILTVGLAEKVDSITTKPLDKINFTRDEMKELRYASILHDFGKVAVPEKILKKGKKLLGSELRNIELRFACRARALEATHLRRKMRAIDAGSLGAEELRALDAEYNSQLRALKEALDAIRQANEPRLVERQGIGALEQSFRTVRGLPVRDFDTLEEEQEIPVEEWMEGPLLSARERDALFISWGSLTEDERENETWGINSHVQHTYEFLEKIPWTGEFRRIPEIAWAHHEKLDGSGYPRKLKGSAITPQSRMMTISDIFDALRAWDRPYKRAVLPNRALEILEGDVKKGKLDGDLFEVFKGSKLWEKDEYCRLVEKPDPRGENGH